MWDKPRPEEQQGYIATVRGSDRPIICPTCGDDFVVYNGNYFCDGWGDTCDWALPHPATDQLDRIVCDLIGISYE